MLRDDDGFPVWEDLGHQLIKVGIRPEGAFRDQLLPAGWALCSNKRVRYKQGCTIYVGQYAPPSLRGGGRGGKNIIICHMREKYERSLKNGDNFSIKMQ